MTTTIRKSARLTGAERDKLARKIITEYNKGKSIRAIAETTGRSYGAIHRMLVDAEGVTLRARGGATYTKAKKKK